MTDKFVVQHKKMTKESQMQRNILDAITSMNIAFNLLTNVNQFNREILEELEKKDNNPEIHDTIELIEQEMEYTSGYIQAELFKLIREMKCFYYFTNKDKE